MQWQLATKDAKEGQRHLGYEGHFYEVHLVSIHFMHSQKQKRKAHFAVTHVFWPEF